MEKRPSSLSESPPRRTRALRRGALALAGLAAIFALWEIAQANPAKSPVKRFEDGTVAWQGRSAQTTASPLRHVPQELLVRFKRDASPAATRAALAAVPAASERKFRTVKRLHHLKLAAGASLHGALEALRSNRDVEYVEPNYVVQLAAAPNDARFTEQWPLQNTGQTGGTAGADVDALAAWDLTTGSSSVVVAVLDTGMDYNHQDLAANVFNNSLDCNTNSLDDDSNGYVDDCHGIDTVNDDTDPMDDEGHGTHVGGTIGAAGNDGVGVAGVNWEVTLLPCKFLDNTGSGSTSGAIACLDYVADLKDRGLNIVATSNSWSGGLYSQALADAIEAQQDRGILFVAAAGNDYTDNDIAWTYPCSLEVPNIVCVAATDDDDARPAFSNHGRTTVHLGAPGSAVLSTLPGDTYGLANGTSMATPHVSGVAALLAAQDPGRDWRELKNLLLAGGDEISALADSTITGRRLNAYGSLTCSGATVLSRVRPTTDMLAGIGATVELSVLNVVCEAPGGAVDVVVDPGSETIPLIDDGTGTDQVAGDGLFAGTWQPSSAGTFTLTFPDLTEVTVEVDPHLEPGFPVKAYAGGGSYHAGPAIHTLVGNIDTDPELEILTTALAQGPLYAWNADASLAAGWPGPSAGATYPALGELHAYPGLEVFSAYYDADFDLMAQTGTGFLVPGWPRESANYVATPPTLANVVGDALAEIFTEEEDWHLHAYDASGAPLPGWPSTEFVGGQERHTSAVADLDGDNDLEIVTVGSGPYLFAYHHDGSTVAGFPVSFSGYVDTFPAIGDVDGDGQHEIVVAGRVSGGTGALVYSVTGALERSLPAAGTVFYGTAPALADLDGDLVPEIILQTNTDVNVWRGDGSTPAGWPVSTGGSSWLLNAAPVVGDLDGDGAPEVVALSLQGGASGASGDALVINANGTIAFQKTVEGLDDGAVPAIADIDLDGRNELAVTSAYWDGTSGYYDKVWVYDFGGPTPHGPVPWGQFMGDPGNQGYYGPPTVVVPAAISISDAIMSEGNCGTSLLTFTVNLAGASSTVVTVDYYIEDFTATAGEDYSEATGTLTFDPGVTFQTVDVPILGDTAFEPDEVFGVRLTGATNATIVDDTGAGTILNDDSDPAAGEAIVWNAAVGVSVCGPGLTKTAPTKWGNAGASSTRGIDPSGTGFVEFTVSADPGYAMFGLSSDDIDQSYPDVDFAFYTYATTGRLLIYEGGSYRGTVGSYAPGDTLRLAVDAGAVTYWRNGVLAYTSSQTPVDPLRIDTSLYSVGAQIQGASLGGTSLVDVVVLPPSEAVVWANLVGVSVSTPGNDVTKAVSSGWGNAGAVSTRGITTAAGGYAEFTLPADPGYAMFGLSNGDTDQSYADIDFAFYTYAATGRLLIYEKGSYRASLGAYAPGDTLRVSVESDIVTYWRNGILVYTAAQTPLSPLQVDTALYSTGALVAEATLSGDIVDVIVPLPTEAVVWRNLLGVSVSTPGNDLAKTAPTVWGNAGASSTQGFSGDGYAEFTLPANPGYVMFGLTAADDDQTYADIDFAFYTYAAIGRLLIYENGAYRTSVGNYAEGDTLRISVDAGAVTYWRNSLQVYVSAQTPAAPLGVDTSLYSTGALVQNALLAGSIENLP